MAKRVLVMSDLHCGHLVGLTPPQWHIREGSPDNLTKRQKYSVIQEEMWELYCKNLRRFKPFDLVVVNGDAIDGKGDRSGGTEQITTDREEQCDMAKVCIRRALSKGTKLVMTYGTPYHTGVDEDHEGTIARDFGAKIGSHEWVEAGGVVFDFKHKVGGSQIPHGRSTAINRDALWSNLWAKTGNTPESDVLIRSHVHYHTRTFDPSFKPYHRMTTPALQGMGSKYGARQCSGLVHMGFLVFGCDRGHYDLSFVEFKPLKQKAEALKV